jgi:hypothetical protein
LGFSDRRAADSDIAASQGDASQAAFDFRYARRQWNERRNPCRRRNQVQSIGSRLNSPLSSRVNDRFGVAL